MISIPAGPTLALTGFLLLLPAAPAAAHDGHAGWNVWTWAPTGTTAIALAVLLYGRGLMTLWRRAGVGRGIPIWRACSYAAGLMALVVALLSPIAYLSESLQSAHMVQHMILLLVATPLLVVGTPLFVMLWALPARWRQRVAQWWHGARRWQATWEALSQPLIVWALYAVTLWVWHVPRFYEAALQNSYVHDLQHLGFLLTSGLLWWLLLNPMGRLRLDRGAGVLYLFTTSLHATALGVFLTLSPTAWYDYYIQTAARWNLTALEDQQIAGAIMWMPACVVYLVIAAIIFSLWLRESEARDRRLERIEVASDSRSDPMDTLLRDAAEGAS
jgi:putative membrane protein